MNDEKDKVPTYTMIVDFIVNCDVIDTLFA